MWQRVLGLAEKADEPSKPPRRKEESRSEHSASGSTISPSSTRKQSRGDDRDRGIDPASATDVRPVHSDVVRTSSVAESMPRTQTERDDRRKEAEDDRKSRRRRERSSSGDRKGHRMDRSRSEERKSKNGRNDKKEKTIKRRSTDPTVLDGRETTRAGEMDRFNSQIGSAGFSQFPGQFDSGEHKPPNGSQRPPHNMSDHVPDMFPGQFPSDTAAPYRPPMAKSEGGPGLAAEYYGDAGQSVAEQPGVRTHSPNLIIGAEPHLMMASSVAAPPPEPSSMGAEGSAAAFFNSEHSFQTPNTSPKPAPQGGPRPQGAPYIAQGALSPGLPPQSHPNQSISISPMTSSSNIPTVGAAAAGAAAGYAMGHHSSSQQIANFNSYHGVGPQELPGSDSPLPASSSTRPPQSGKHSASNVPLAAAAAGAAGLAAAAYQHHQGHHDSYYSQNGSNYPTAMTHRHHHSGPFAKFVDFFRDPDGVAQFEEYSEYIGVCRGCFEPGSSPRDAPRKHHHRRRKSYDKLRTSTRVDKENRYYVSSDEERRKSKKGWLAAAATGVGLAQVGRNLFGDPNDFQDTYSVKSGRYNESTTSVHRRSSPTSYQRVYTTSESKKRDDNRRVSFGIAVDDDMMKKVSRKSYDGGSRVSARADRGDRKSRQRSRSHSRERDHKFRDAAIGAAAGAVIASTVSRKRTPSPPQEVLRVRHESQQESKERESRRRQSADRSSGFLGRFFSPPDQDRSRRKKKQDKGFFNFGNVSSSSDSGSAFGGTSRKSSSKKMSSQKIKSDDEARAALMGIGAAAAAIAAHENRSKSKNHQRPSVVAVKDTRGKHRKHADNTDSKQDSKRRRPRSDSLEEEDLWESASEDEGYSSVDSALAFGLSRHGSRDSIKESGTDKWDWRWGNKKQRRHSHESPDRHFTKTAAIATAAGVAGMTAGHAGASRSKYADSGTHSAGSLQSMQHVYPMPTSDPTSYDAVTHDPATGQTMRSSRPDPVPIQQPRPIVPVPSTVYTQAVTEQSYPALSGLPHSTQSDPDGDASMYGSSVPGAFPTRNDNPEDDSRHRSDGQSSMTRDDTQRSSRFRDEGPSVKFGPTEEKEERRRKEERKERRRSEKARAEAERREYEEQMIIDRENRNVARTRQEQLQKLERQGDAGREGRDSAKRTVDPDAKSTQDPESQRYAEMEREIQRMAQEEAPAAKRKQDSGSHAAEAALAGAAVGAAAAALAQKSKTSKGERQSRRTERQDDAEDPSIESSAKRKAKIRIAARSPSPAAHESYADYFVPADILSKPAGEKQRASDPNADADISAHNVLIEPPQFSGRYREPEIPKFEDEGDLVATKRRKSFTWVVPPLNLIYPTPSPSRMGSRASSVQPSPIIAPKDAPVEEEENYSKPSRSVSFGNNQTHEYEVVTPEDHRDEYIASTNGGENAEKRSENRSPTTPVTPADLESPVEEIPRRSMPGVFDDDPEFAATLAAGAEAAGFDANIVIDDPIYRQRDSPPGSQDRGDFYAHPYYETVSDIALDSPRSRGAPPQRGWVEEGELPETPKDFVSPTVPEDKESDPDISRKERRKRERAAKRRSADQEITTIEDQTHSTAGTDISADPDDAELEIVEDAAREAPSDFERAKSKKSKKKKSKRESASKTELSTKEASTKDASDLDRKVAISESSEKLSRGRDGAFDGPLLGDDQESLASSGVNGSNKSAGADQDEEIYESPNEYAASAASAPLSNERDDSTKRKKKSKRRSTGPDDSASTISSPAQIDEAKEAISKSKKKGSLWNLFRPASEDVPKKSDEKSQLGEVRDDFEEPKKKGRKGRKSQDVDNWYNVPEDGISGELQQKDEAAYEQSPNTRKEEKRRSRGESREDGELGRQSQDLPDKNQGTDSNRAVHGINEAPARFAKSDELDKYNEQQSSLGMRREETEPPDIFGRAQDPGGGDYFSRRRSSSSPPTSRPTTPPRIDWTRDDDYVSSVPSPTRLRRLSALQTDTAASPATPSPTAVPLIFRKPHSAGLTRSSSATPVSSPSLITPRTRRPRPLSTEFKTNEFRPLWLIERHQSKQGFDPEEVLPSLPSSHSGSRASSVHEGEGASQEKPARDTKFKGEPLDIQATKIDKHDVFDSQETTPTAASYQAKTEEERRKRAQERERDLIAQATQEAMAREHEWNQMHNRESPQRRRSETSTFWKDAGLAALAGTTAAVALTHHDDHHTTATKERVHEPVPAGETSLRETPSTAVQEDERWRAVENVRPRSALPLETRPPKLDTLAEPLSEIEGPEKKVFHTSSEARSSEFPDDNDLTRAADEIPASKEHSKIVEQESKIDLASEAAEVDMLAKEQSVDPLLSRVDSKKGKESKKGKKGKKLPTWDDFGKNSGEEASTSTTSRESSSPKLKAQGEAGDCASSPGAAIGATAGATPGAETVALPESNGEDLLEMYSLQSGLFKKSAPRDAQQTQLAEADEAQVQAVRPIGSSDVKHIAAATGDPAFNMVLQKTAASSFEESDLGHHEPEANAIQAMQHDPSLPLSRQFEPGESTVSMVSREKGKKVEKGKMYPDQDYEQAVSAEQLVTDELELPLAGKADRGTEEVSPYPEAVDEDESAVIEEKGRKGKRRKKSISTADTFTQDSDLLETDLAAHKEALNVIGLQGRAPLSTQTEALPKEDRDHDTPALQEHLSVTDAPRTEEPIETATSEKAPVEPNSTQIVDEDEWDSFPTKKEKKKGKKAKAAKAAAVAAAAAAAATTATATSILKHSFTVDSSTSQTPSDEAERVVENSNATSANEYAVESEWTIPETKGKKGKKGKKARKNLGDDVYEELEKAESAGEPQTSAIDAPQMHDFEKPMSRNEQNKNRKSVAFRDEAVTDGSTQEAVNGQGLVSGESLELRDEEATRVASPDNLTASPGIERLESSRLGEDAYVPLSSGVVGKDSSSAVPTTESHADTDAPAFTASGDFYALHGQEVQGDEFSLQPRDGHVLGNRILEKQQGQLAPAEESFEISRELPVEQSHEQISLEMGRTQLSNDNFPGESLEPLSAADPKLEITQLAAPSQESTVSDNLEDSFVPSKGKKGKKGKKNQALLRKFEQDELLKDQVGSAGHSASQDGIHTPTEDIVYQDQLAHDEPEADASSAETKEGRYPTFDGSTAAGDTQVETSATKANSLDGRDEYATGIGMLPQANETSTTEEAPNRESGEKGGDTAVKPDDGFADVSSIRRSSSNTKGKEARLVDSIRNGANEADSEKPDIATGVPEIPLEDKQDVDIQRPEEQGQDSQDIDWMPSKRSKKAKSKKRQASTQGSDAERTGDDATAFENAAIVGATATAAAAAATYATNKTSHTEAAGEDIEGSSFVSPVNENESEMPEDLPWPDDTHTTREPPADATTDSAVLSGERIQTAPEEIELFQEIAAETPLKKGKKKKKSKSFNWAEEAEAEAPRFETVSPALQAKSQEPTSETQARTVAESGLEGQTQPLANLQEPMSFESSQEPQIDSQVKIQGAKVVEDAEAAQTESRAEAEVERTKVTQSEPQADLQEPDVIEYGHEPRFSGSAAASRDDLTITEAEQVEFERAMAEMNEPRASTSESYDRSPSFKIVDLPEKKEGSEQESSLGGAAQDAMPREASSSTEEAKPEIMIQTDVEPSMGLEESLATATPPESCELQSMVDGQDTRTVYEAAEAGEAAQRTLLASEAPSTPAEENWDGFTAGKKSKKSKKNPKKTEQALTFDEDPQVETFDAEAPAEAVLASEAVRSQGLPSDKEASLAMEDTTEVPQLVISTDDASFAGQLKGKKGKKGKKKQAFDWTEEPDPEPINDDLAHAPIVATVGAGAPSAGLQVKGEGVDGEPSKTSTSSKYDSGKRAGSDTPQDNQLVSEEQEVLSAEASLTESRATEPSHGTEVPEIPQEKPEQEVEFFPTKKSKKGKKAKRAETSWDDPESVSPGTSTPFDQPTSQRAEETPLRQPEDENLVKEEAPLETPTFGKKGKKNKKKKSQFVAWEEPEEQVDDQDSGIAEQNVRGYEDRATVPNPVPEDLAIDGNVAEDTKDAERNLYPEPGWSFAKDPSLEPKSNYKDQLNKQESKEDKFETIPSKSKAKKGKKSKKQLEWEPEPESISLDQSVKVTETTDQELQEATLDESLNPPQILQPPDGASNEQLAREQGEVAQQEGQGDETVPVVPADQMEEELPDFPTKKGKKGKKGKKRSETDAVLFNPSENLGSAPLREGYEQLDPDSGNQSRSIDSPISVTQESKIDDGDDWTGFATKKKKKGKKGRKQSTFLGDETPEFEDGELQTPQVLDEDERKEIPKESEELTGQQEFTFNQEPSGEPMPLLDDTRHKSTRPSNHGLGFAAAASIAAAPGLFRHKDSLIPPQVQDFEPGPPSENDWDTAVGRIEKSKERKDTSFQASEELERRAPKEAAFHTPPTEGAREPETWSSTAREETTSDGIPDAMVQRDIGGPNEAPVAAQPEDEWSDFNTRKGKKSKKCRRQTFASQDEGSSAEMPWQPAASAEDVEVAAPDAHPATHSRSSSIKDAAKAVGAVGASIALFEGIHRAASVSEEQRPRHQSRKDSRSDYPEAVVSDEEPQPVEGSKEIPLANNRLTKHAKTETSNRDSALHMESPMVPEPSHRYDSVRDSGFQDEPEGMDQPLKVSIETTPDYDVHIRSPRRVEHLQDNREPQLPSPADSRQASPRRHLIAREPSPVDSTTKDRATSLFGSSPSTRDDHQYHNRHRSIDEITSPSPAQSNSLFGGPVGVSSDRDFESLQSPPRSPLTIATPNRPLATIEERSPEDSPRPNKQRQDSGTSQIEPSLKPARRSITPHSLSHQRVRSPNAESPRRLGLISTDDLISRLSWPDVDEEKHAVDLERSLSRNTDRDRKSSGGRSRPPSLTIDPNKVRDQSRRSTSGTSVRSTDSVNAIIRSPPLSTTGTPPLRRVDRSLSSDLRTANRRDEQRSEASLGSLEETKPGKGAKSGPTEGQVQSPNLEGVASSSTYDPAKDKGKGRITKMADVYEGYGDFNGSPRSPTRPQSVRRRQSLQILDLESRMDQLVSENRLLVDAKNRAERSLDQAVHDHSQQTHALNEALETRDLYLRQKDEELEELKRTLQGLHEEVGKLSEANKELGTSRDVDGDFEQRYQDLESEHNAAREQLEGQSQELEQLRHKHTSLSGGMEGIVAAEVALAVQSKDAELKQLRGELETAKEQVRKLQQEIMAARRGDDMLVEHDEDYFDTKCEQLCGHVQQWVMRFSKFSDNKICRKMEEVADEKITDRFDNSMLDGTDVNLYLAHRIKRRDVFMSVMMTMVWEFIFTRYLFGMDREQRQKLKYLDKTLKEVGPPSAVNKWRATTLSMLAKRDGFQALRQSDTEAVVYEIYNTLAAFLTPPSHLVEQLQDSLRKVLSTAVDLSIEMRTQKAEYLMLPPPQPAYNTNGDLETKVFFDADYMNERSGDTLDNKELEEAEAVVRIVLFPLVIKQGDDDREIICPAQVLVAKEESGDSKGKRSVRVMSAQGNRSQGSFAPSQMEGGYI